MYPDTDLPPKRITDDRRERIREWLPINFWTRDDRYRKLGVPEDLIQDLSVSHFSPLFETFVGKWNISAKLAAAVLIQYPKRLKKNGLAVQALDENTFKAIFSAYRQGMIPQDALFFVCRRAAEHGSFSEEQLPQSCAREEVQDVIKEAKVTLAGIRVRHEEKKSEILMGIVMKKLRGRVGSAVVLEQIESEL
jgi:glutamyl-tRNA(Gln) amidotransferase subunit E